MDEGVAGIISEPMPESIAPDDEDIDIESTPEIGLAIGTPDEETSWKISSFEGVDVKLVGIELAIAIELVTDTEPLSLELENDAVEGGRENIVASESTIIDTASVAEGAVVSMSSEVGSEDSGASVAGAGMNVGAPASRLS